MVNYDHAAEANDIKFRSSLVKPLVANTLALASS